MLRSVLLDVLSFLAIESCKSGSKLPSGGCEVAGGGESQAHPPPPPAPIPDAKKSALRGITRGAVASDRADKADTAAVGPALESARAPDPFFFSSRRRHTRFDCDWSSDVCSSD